MGYSVAAVFTNNAEVAAMRRFLKKNFRDWSVLIGEKDDYLRGPASDLSYDHGRFRLGFDYNTGGAERQYAFAVVRWMALRSKKVDRKERSFYVYDGHERTFLAIINTKPPGKIPFDPKTEESVEQCDSNGMSWDFVLDADKYKHLASKKELKIIADELQRLSDLWQKEHE